MPIRAVFALVESYFFGGKSVRKSKKLLAIMLGAVMAFGVCATAACTKTPAGPDENSGQNQPEEPQVTAGVHSVTLKTGGRLVGGTLDVGLAGGAVTLDALVIKDDDADGKLTWTSSDKAVATVADGVVTPKTAGETEIRAEAGGKSATVKITIREGTVTPESKTPEVAAVVIKYGGKVVENSVTVYLEDESAKLDAIVIQDDDAEASVKWSGNDNDVATVSSQGTLKLKTVGAMKAKAEAGGKSAEVLVKIAKKAAADYEPTPAVQSVAIRYNDSNVTSTLSTNLSARSLSLTPVVTAEEGADYFVEWTSSEESVATIEGDNDGATVTLVGGGETVIKAIVSEEIYGQFVLVVGDDSPVPKYRITVVDGVAKNSQGVVITEAEAGTQVTLEPAIPAHTEFTRWTIGSEIELNGSCFTMPKEDVSASAGYEDILYPLTVIGGRVIKAGATDSPKGTQTEGEEGLQYAFKYGTQITIKADAPQSNMTFVGWDYQAKDNRAGELGVDEYTFPMGDAETSTYTSVYSTYDRLVWNPESLGGSDHVQCTIWNYTTFENGNNDPDLDGLSGLTLRIPDNDQKMDGSTETLPNTKWMFEVKGRGMGRIILKNHSNTTSVKLEFYASYCGILATSGIVEVGPGEVVSKCFTIFGIPSNCNWGVSLRESLGGSGSGTVDVDAALGIATSIYPDGDPFLLPADLAATDKVNLGKDADRIYGDTWGSVAFYPGLGSASLQGWQSAFGRDDAARWIGVPIKDLPADDGSGKTYIYGRIINLASSMNTDTTPANYKFVIATGDSPSEGVVATQDVYVENYGDIVLLKFELPRTSADEVFKFYLVKEHIEEEAVEYGYGYALSIQLTYKNIFGYEEA